uniref:Uncharacterized protein n=1 Tax=Oryza nivara TaxID=4536 RepID=A0A0E0G3J4_ORYNI
MTKCGGGGGGDVAETDSGVGAMVGTRAFLFSSSTEHQAALHGPLPGNCQTFSRASTIQASSRTTTKHYCFSSSDRADADADSTAFSSTPASRALLQERRGDRTPMVMTRQCCWRRTSPSGCGYITVVFCCGRVGRVER